MNVALTLKSSNAKTGPIPVSVTERSTCAPTCPLDRNGCYADAGFRTRLHWDKVSSGERGGTWAQFIAAVKALSPGQLWRHNVAGDLPHVGGHLVPKLVAELAKANAGKAGFTYTHHLPGIGRNLEVLQDANAAGFTVNLSANGPGEVDALMATGLPVVTILPATENKITVTELGAKIVTCPATYRDTNCANCGLCQRKDRSYAIGFPVHGAGASKINVQ